MKGGRKTVDFEDVYRAHFKDVYLYILRLSGDEHIAEEITSETFFKAISAIDRFRGECDVRVWLCQIAKNLYYGYRKKRRRLVRMEAAEQRGEPDRTDEKMLDREEAMQLQKMLHGMEEPYKEVFMWRVFAQMSFKQIAQIFGKTDNWACVVYHRAKMMIKKKMEDKEHEK